MLNNLRLIVLACDRSNSVPLRPTLRNASIKTWANDDKVQSKLVCSENAAAGAICKQTQLLHFYLVFHFSTNTIQLFIQGLSISKLGRQIRHNESWISPFAQIFRFRDNSTFTAPAFARSIPQPLKQSGWRSRLITLLLCLFHGTCNGSR